MLVGHGSETPITDIILAHCTCVDHDAPSQCALENCHPSQRTWWFHPSRSLDRPSREHQFKMRWKFRRGKFSDEDLSAVIVTPGGV